MQSIDTNVVVRLLVHDDEDQGRRAEAAFRRALDAGGVWIPQVVLVEAVWVLRSGYKFDRASITTVLRNLIGTEGVIVEQQDLMLGGLSAFESGEADFADQLILGSARRARALPLWTFDERLSRLEGVEQVP